MEYLQTTLVALGFVGFTALCYDKTYGYRRNRHASYFIAALIAFAFTAAIPTNLFGADFQFSTHMVEHMSLLLLVTPLAVMGLPAKGRLAKRISATTFHQPWIGWLAGMSAMWIWHLPVIALHSTELTWLHNATVLIAGLLFAMPVLTPFSQYRLSPISSMVYLATACVCCSLLGFIISLASPGTYAISGVDQHTAGMIMWIPGSSVYLIGALLSLTRWYNEKEETTWITP
jgi:putative membrane protein